MPSRPCRKPASRTRRKVLKAPEQRAVRIIANSDDGGGGGIVVATTAAIWPSSCARSDKATAGSPTSISADPCAGSTSIGSPTNAWINWNFNDFGWLKDNRTLWYMKRGTLFAASIRRRWMARRGADFWESEVNDLLLSDDGKRFYVRNNDVRAVQLRRLPFARPVTGGALSRITNYQGMDDFKLIRGRSAARRAALRTLRACAIGRPAVRLRHAARADQHVRTGLHCAPLDCVEHRGEV